MKDDYNQVPRNPVVYGMLSLFCGVIGTAVVFMMESMAIASVGLGAVGMLVGGFSISIASHFPNSKDKASYMGLAAAGIMASVIAFMFGIVNAFG